MNTTLSPGFEQNLGTLLVGADTLWGGNIKGSAADRFILDHWVSGRGLPTIYHDTRARLLREAGGVRPKSNPALVNAFVHAYHLLELPATVRAEIPYEDHLSRKFVDHLTHALEVIVQTAVATVDSGHHMPSFDERRRASTGETEITLLDPAPLREEMREALNDFGISTTPENVRDKYIAWKQERVVSPEQVAGYVGHIKEELLAAFKRRVLSHFDDHRLRDITLHGHTFRTIQNQPYTGFNQYDGGEDEQGKPLFTGLFEFNVDHPVTEANLYYLVAHEVIAHYVSCVIRDLSYRRGHHGIESTMGTMCSPQVVEEEGLAETMMHLLYGSREAAIGAIGPELRVVLAADELEQVAKANVGILHLRDGRSLDEVKRYVAEDCLQEEAIVNKMSRLWATHPIFAPMYGPAYAYGSRIVRQAVQDIGPLQTAHIGFHLEGLMDIMTFQEKVRVRKGVPALALASE